MLPNTLVPGVIAAAPDADDQVLVTLPAFAADQPIGPCVYMPRGASAPAAGDECLVGFDEHGNAWIVAYDGVTASIPGGGTDGRTVLSGTTAPGSGVGSNGDFYIRTSNWTIYGPKTAGTWGAPTSLVGPAGTAGADGADGADGPPGAPGEPGAPGAPGPAGEAPISLAGLIWHDDFTTDRLAEYVVLDETTSGATGATVTDGVLTTSTSHGVAVFPTALKPAHEFTAQAKLIGGSGTLGGFGFHLRFIDASNSLWCQVQGDGNIVVYKKSGGVDSAVASTGSGAASIPTDGQARWLRAQIIGTRLYLTYWTTDPEAAAGTTAPANTVTYDLGASAADVVRYLRPGLRLGLRAGFPNASWSIDEFKAWAAPGVMGEQGEPGPQNLFIQPTTPASSDPYLWIDTSDGRMYISA